MNWITELKKQFLLSLKNFLTSPAGVLKGDFGAKEYYKIFSCFSKLNIVANKFVKQNSNSGFSKCS